MVLDEPYFMMNTEWYYYDYKTEKYILTDSAPREAVESYKTFYEEIQKVYGSN